MNSNKYVWRGPPHPELGQKWGKYVRRKTVSSTDTLPTEFRAGECFRISYMGTKLLALLIGMKRAEEKDRWWVFLIDFESLALFQSHPHSANEYPEFVKRLCHREMQKLFRYEFPAFGMEKVECTKFNSDQTKWILKKADQVFCSMFITNVKPRAFTKDFVLQYNQSKTTLESPTPHIRSSSSPREKGLRCTPDMADTIKQLKHAQNSLRQLEREKETLSEIIESKDIFYTPKEDLVHEC